MRDKISKHLEKYLLPITALLVFLTWVLKVPQVANIIIYSLITLGLVFFKVKPTTMLMYSLLTIASNYHPIRIESLNRGYHIVFYFTFGITMIYSLVNVFKNNFKLIYKLLIPFGLMIIYGLISLIWSLNVMYGFNFLQVMILGYVAYLVVVNLDEKFDYLKLSWFLTLLLLVISSQYLVVAYNHFEVDLTGQTGILKYFSFIKQKFFSFERKTHLFIFWANPNIVAAMIGISLVPSLYKYFDKRSTKKTLYYLPLELLPLYAIYASMSDGLFSALIIGILFIPLIFLYKNKRHVFIWYMQFVALFMAFVLVVVYTLNMYPEIFTDIDNFTTGRFTLYRQSVDLFKNPLVLLFGRGIGSSKAILESSFYYHSWAFNSLANVGVIGFGLTIYVIYQSFNIINESKNPFRYFLLIGTIIYLTHGLIDVGYDYQYIGILNYMMIAMIEKDNYKLKLEQTIETVNV